jgi:hypothetical protein
MAIHSRIGEVTERIRLRRRESRTQYRERVASAGAAGPRRPELFAAFRAFAGPAETGAGIAFRGRA